MNFLQLFSPMVVYATDVPEAGGNIMSALAMPVLLIVVFYFMIIRPQRKKDKKVKEMIASDRKSTRLNSSH